MTDIIVVIGSRSIGQAIARRVSAGRKVLLADLQPDHADAVAAQMVDAGFDVCSTTVDVTSRESVNQLVERAAGLGRVFGIIHTAGVSPSNASALPQRLCGGPSGATVPARLGVAFLGKGTTIPCETRLDSRRHTGSERYLISRMAH